MNYSQVTRKSSGVNWIGEIPNHWKVGRLKKGVSLIINGVWGNEPNEDGNDIYCVRVADYNRVNMSINESNLTNRSIELKDRVLRILEHGDLLIERSGGGERQPVGFVVRFTGDYQAVFTNFMSRLKMSPYADSNYLKYIFKAMYDSRSNTKSIKQTTGIQNLDLESYLNESIPYPPIDEQVTIAGFLDKETSKIDTLIDKKQRMIELLQEKRKALITDAVTKGLDPSVPMKDSGIPWLGEVPVHWGIKKIKHLSPFVSRGISPMYTEESKFPIINQSCIRWDGIVLESVKFSANDKPEQLKGYLHHLDVLMNSTGTGTLGRVALIEQPKNIIADSHVTIIRSNKKLLNPYFLKYLLSTQTYQGFIYSYAVTGATNQIELSREKLREVPLYIPLLEEQERIVTSVLRQEQNINKVIKKIKSQITKLQEYRQALITAAVTGKIDIREKKISS